MSRICWQGAVQSAIKGKRGQQFLRDLLAALDAMPTKRLIAEELERQDGEVCAIGALGKVRGVDMSTLDPKDYEIVAKSFGIASALVREIVYENDEGCYDSETPGRRWARMRNWVARAITSTSCQD